MVTRWAWPLETAWCSSCAGQCPAPCSSSTTAAVSPSLTAATRLSSILQSGAAAAFLFLNSQSIYFNT